MSTLISSDGKTAIRNNQTGGGGNPSKKKYGFTNFNVRDYTVNFESRFRPEILMVSHQHGQSSVTLRAISGGDERRETITTTTGDLPLNPEFL